MYNITVQLKAGRVKPSPAGRVVEYLGSDDKSFTKLEDGTTGNMTELLRKVFPLVFFFFALVSCTTSQENLTTSPLSTPSSLPTSTANLRPTTTPSLSPTKSSPSQIPVGPTSITPTTTVLENGLTWTECAVPNRDYAMTKVDMAILEQCAVRPKESAADAKIMGERVEGSQGFHDLRITIGADSFAAKLVDRKDSFHYELTRNGEVIARATTGYTTYDPNQNFWNIDGQLVWELAGSVPAVIVDGVNYNEKYQLEGSYFPYEIKGKLIFVAEKKGQFSVVYDGKTVGPEFDEISMPYCCAMVPLFRGNGQYWFVGSREGTKYLVSIR